MPYVSDGTFGPVTLVIVSAIALGTLWLTLLLSRDFRKMIHSRICQWFLKKIHTCRWLLRASLLLFIALWIFAGYYDLGWRAHPRNYIILERGLFYVLYDKGFMGIGPYWTTDWVFTFRRHHMGPSLWAGLDLATDLGGFGIPLWLFGYSLFLLSFIPALTRHATTRRRFPIGNCNRCGYDLAGLSTKTCPECGTSLSPDDSPAAPMQQPTKR